MEKSIESITEELSQQRMKLEKLDKIEEMLAALVKGKSVEESVGISQVTASGEPNSIHRNQIPLENSLFNLLESCKALIKLSIICFPSSSVNPKDSAPVSISQSTHCGNETAKNSPSSPCKLDFIKTKTPLALGIIVQPSVLQAQSVVVTWKHLYQLPTICNKNRYLTFCEELTKLSTFRIGMGFQTDSPFNLLESCKALIKLSIICFPSSSVNQKGRVYCTGALDFPAECLLELCFCMSHIPKVMSHMALDINNQSAPSECLTYPKNSCRACLISTILNMFACTILTSCSSTSLDLDVGSLSLSTLNFLILLWRPFLHPHGPLVRGQTLVRPRTRGRLTPARLRALLLLLAGRPIFPLIQVRYPAKPPHWTTWNTSPPRLYLGPESPLISMQVAPKHLVVHELYWPNDFAINVIADYVTIVTKNTARITLVRANSCSSWAMTMTMSQSATHRNPHLRRMGIFKALLHQPNPLQLFLLYHYATEPPSGHSTDIVFPTDIPSEASALLHDFQDFFQTPTSLHSSLAVFFSLTSSPVFNLMDKLHQENSADPFLHSLHAKFKQGILPSSYSVSNGLLLFGPNEDEAQDITTIIPPEEPKEKDPKGRPKRYVKKPGWLED
ncbi:hypothetical protein DH2020_001092 [Rehmannia glutinosa]|uniref:Uncharacterized protein n=1 Tax=Rehmannia glutinosa TaxID=99300 RepID=A0ABR0XYT4_REHGL